MDRDQPGTKYQMETDGEGTACVATVTVANVPLGLRAIACVA